MIRRRQRLRMHQSNNRRRCFQWSHSCLKAVQIRHSTVAKLMISQIEIKTILRWSRLKVSSKSLTILRMQCGRWVPIPRWKSIMQNQLAMLTFPRSLNTPRMLRRNHYYHEITIRRQIIQACSNSRSHRHPMRNKKGQIESKITSKRTKTSSSWLRFMTVATPLLKASHIQAVLKSRGHVLKSWMKIFA